VAAVYEVTGPDPPTASPPAVGASAPAGSAVTVPAAVAGVSVHAVQDDLRRLRRGYRCLVPEPVAGVDEKLAQVLGGRALGAQAGRDQVLELGVGHLLGVGQAAATQRVPDDVGADVPWHDDGRADMRSVRAQVFDERLGEAPDRELGGAVGGLRPARAEGGPQSR